jgi:hypothetical protein
MRKFAYVIPYRQGVPNYLPKQMFKSMLKLQAPKTVPVSWIQRKSSSLVGLNKHFMGRFLKELCNGRSPNPTIRSMRKGKVDIEDLLS